MTAGTVGARVVAAVAVAVVLLAGCDPVTQDRQEGGTTPDRVADTSHVTVWRNVDNAPNVIVFCADGLAWAATSSVDGARTPSLLRVPERDSRCAS